MQLGLFTSTKPCSPCRMSSKVSASTTRTDMLGSGRPTLPSRVPSCVTVRFENPGVFAVAHGPSSVHPYPASSFTPNLFRNSSAMEALSASAPTRMYCREENCSRVHLRMYVKQNVGVDKKNVGRCSSASSPITRASVGFG